MDCEHLIGEGALYLFVDQGAMCHFIYAHFNKEYYLECYVDILNEHLAII